VVRWARGSAWVGGVFAGVGGGALVGRGIGGGVWFVFGGRLGDIEYSVNSIDSEGAFGVAQGAEGVDVGAIVAFDFEDAEGEDAALHTEVRGGIIEDGNQSFFCSGAAEGIGVGVCGAGDGYSG